MKFYDHPGKRNVSGDRFVADFEVITRAEVLEVPVLWLLGIE